MLTLERDVLIGAEVRGERHDAGAEGYRGVHVLGEPALAAVAAGALHPHLEMPRHRRHDRKRDVHHLPRGGDCRGFHVQRFPDCANPVQTTGTQEWLR